MQRKKASDFHPEVLSLFDQYVHGSIDDTTPRYDKAAADLAWKRTIEFFEQHLRR